MRRVGGRKVWINRLNAEMSACNVEAGLLQLLKSILVFERHVRFKVMNLHTPLPECCLHCVGEFAAMRDLYLVNRGEHKVTEEKRIVSKTHPTLFNILWRL